MTAVITAEGLQKKFGDQTAVNHVDLTVPPGVFYGFIGPNGAGKTTTIRLLTGLIQPTSGTVSLFGKTYDEDGPDIRARIGLVQDDLLLYDYLTCEEQLLFSGRAYGMPQGEVLKRSDELFPLFDLDPCRNRLVRTCSHGERKKLALACALIHDPDLLFLDEPFEGMDVVALRKIEENLRRMVERGKTVFLTSHILSWVDRFCEEVAVINKGSIVFSGTRSMLQEAIKGVAVQDDPGSELERAFLALIQTEESGEHLSWLR